MKLKKLSIKKAIDMSSYWITLEKEIVKYIKKSLKSWFE